MVTPARSRNPDAAIPADAVTNTIAHTVNFHETDAMGIVHHANYICLLEEGRVGFIAEHHRPYTDYIEQELHFAVTRVECQYHRPARFADPLDVTTALRWVGGASICFLYEIKKETELLVSATTEHALVRNSGRARRIPPDFYRALLPLSIEGKKPPEA